MVMVNPLYYDIKSIISWMIKYSQQEMERFARRRKKKTEVIKVYLSCCLSVHFAIQSLREKGKNVYVAYLDMMSL